MCPTDSGSVLETPKATSAQGMTAGDGHRQPHGTSKDRRVRPAGTSRRLPPLDLIPQLPQSRSLRLPQNTSSRDPPPEGFGGGSLGTFVIAHDTPSVSQRLPLMAQCKTPRACTPVFSRGTCPLRHLHRDSQRRKLHQKNSSHISEEEPETSEVFPELVPRQHSEV